MSYERCFWLALMDGALPEAAWAVPLRGSTLDTVEHSVRALPRSLSTLLPLGMRVFEVLAFVRTGRSFSGLDAAGRREFLAWALHCPLRPVATFAQGASRILMFAFYQEPEVLERLDYPIEDWVREKRHERRTHLGA